MEILSDVEFTLNLMTRLSVPRLIKGGLSETTRIVYTWLLILRRALSFACCAVLTLGSHSLLLRLNHSFNPDIRYEKVKSMNTRQTSFGFLSGRCGDI